jgi:hypothetical protein
VAANINAAALHPGSYQGMLIFSNGLTTQQVTVSLAVTAAPQAVISLQTPSLSFSAIKGVNPAAQTLTFQNTGNAPLNWTINKAGSAAGLLAVAPYQGSLAMGQSVSLSVSPDVSNVDAGALEGTIIIVDDGAGSRATSQSVPVTINITDQAVISAAPAGLSFDNSGQLATTSQPLEISNAGSAALNWTIAQPGGTAVSWLSLDNNGGSIAPGATDIVNVSCTSNGMTPGTYEADLVISDSDTGTAVAAQTIHIVLVVE